MSSERGARDRIEATALPGTVVDALPRGLYRVALDSRRHVVAHASRDQRRNFVRVLVGDRVTVELSRVDQSRGRITRRLAQGAGR